MICYATMLPVFKLGSFAFQTKLTYGMICYFNKYPEFQEVMFQTKLTYGMICYTKRVRR